MAPRALFVLLADGYRVFVIYIFIYKYLHTYARAQDDDVVRPEGENIILLLLLLLQDKKYILYRKSRRKERIPPGHHVSVVCERGVIMFQNLNTYSSRICVS